MGFYVNPPNESKESFLKREGMAAQWLPAGRPRGQWSFYRCRDRILRKRA